MKQTWSQLTAKPISGFGSSAMLLQSTTATAASRIEIIQSIERRSGPNSKCPRGGWLAHSFLLPNLTSPSLYPSSIACLRSRLTRPPLFRSDLSELSLSLSFLAASEARGRYGRRGRSRRPCVSGREGGQRASERASDKDDDTRKTNSLPPSLLPLGAPSPFSRSTFRMG